MNHKSFDFTQLGGFPLEQERLAWMQQSYTEALHAITSLIGDNVIVSGCVITGDNVSDGWVVVGGELLPFRGGVKQDYITIKDIAVSLEFEDASFKAVQLSKYCEFGTSGLSFSSLTRLRTIKQLATETGMSGTFKNVNIQSLETMHLHYLSQEISGFNADQWFGILENVGSGVIGITWQYANAAPVGTLGFMLSVPPNMGISADINYILIKK